MAITREQLSAAMAHIRDTQKAIDAMPCADESADVIDTLDRADIALRRAGRLLSTLWQQRA